MQKSKLQFKIQNFIFILLSLPILFIKFDIAHAPSSSLNQKPQTTTLLAVGDIMLSRHVSTKIEQTQNPLLPFENTQELIQSADIAFGNLECPLDPGDTRIREGLIFRCLTKDLAGLVESGFDVLSTANNHSFDQGLDNLEFTVDYLKSQGILPVGTTQPDDVFTNSMELVNGVRFGFLTYSYSAFNDGKFSTHAQIATMDTQQLQRDIADLKSKAHIIIVSMHAGIEYARNPNQKQIDFAHAAIDAGADIVIGHHPHWIQTIEAYESPLLTSPTRGAEPTNTLPPLDGEGEGGVDKPHRGIIFYSLGNFVFDQMWSQETREGLMVKLNFEGKQIKSAELIPIIIDNYCCPRLADEEETQQILQKINLETRTIILK